MLWEITSESRGQIHVFGVRIAAVKTLISHTTPAEMSCGLNASCLGTVHSSSPAERPQWSSQGGRPLEMTKHYLSLWLCESVLSVRNWKALLVYGMCYPVHQQPKKGTTRQLAHHSDFPSPLFSFGSLPATRLSATLSWGRWFADVWQRGGRSGSFMHVAPIYEITVIWPEVINL